MDMCFNPAPSVLQPQLHFILTPNVRSFLPLEVKLHPGPSIIHLVLINSHDTRHQPPTAPRSSPRRLSPFRAPRLHILVQASRIMRRKSLQGPNWSSCLFLPGCRSGAPPTHHRLVRPMSARFKHSMMSCITNFRKAINRRVRYWV